MILDILGNRSADSQFAEENKTERTYYSLIPRPSPDVWAFLPPFRSSLLLRFILYTMAWELHETYQSLVAKRLPANLE